MTKKKETDESAQESEQTAPICKRCKKPIVNPNGDNGCGAHTEDLKTVTNCVAQPALNS